MPLNLLLPETSDDGPFVTNLMRRHADRTVTAVATGGLGVWSGRSRVGKTTTALWLVRELENAYDPANPRTFRGFYYEVGEIRAGGGNEEKRAIAGLHYQLLRAPISDGEYRRLPSEGLAERLVGTMRRTGRRALFVDEAGNLSLHAIRGLVLVRDVAEQMGWPVSVVFIGMDDLPTKIEQLEQVKNRVHAWCYFEEYSLAETRKLLAALHPHFRVRACGGAAADGANGEVARAEETAYIHKHFGGYPGKYLPFLRQVDLYARKLCEPISLAVLTAAREFLVRDRDRSVDDAANGYRQSPAPGRDDPERTDGPKQPPPGGTGRRKSDGAARPRRGRKQPPRRAGGPAPEPPEKHLDAGDVDDCGPDGRRDIA